MLVKKDEVSVSKAEDEISRWLSSIQSPLQPPVSFEGISRGNGLKGPLTL